MPGLLQRIRGPRLLSPIESVSRTIFAHRVFMESTEVYVKKLKNYRMRFELAVKIVKRNN